MKHKSSFEFGKNCSRFGKKECEEKMQSVALSNAIDWTDKLMKLEDRGHGDKEYLARFRVAEKTGVPERYLYRLQYQWRGMKDVAGEVYRLLTIAKEKYIEACEANEEAADAMRAERMELRKQNEAAQELHHQGSGMAAPGLGAKETQETEE